MTFYFNVSMKIIEVITFQIHSFTFKLNSTIYLKFLIGVFNWSLSKDSGQHPEHFFDTSKGTIIKTKNPTAYLHLHMENIDLPLCKVYPYRAQSLKQNLNSHILSKWVFFFEMDSFACHVSLVIFSLWMKLLFSTHAGVQHSFFLKTFFCF